MMASVTVESISSITASNGDNRPSRSSQNTAEVARPPRTSSMYATTTPIKKAKEKEQENLPQQDQEQPTEWGRNFWVTLVDPQTQSQFYACPSTGQTTWDAPVGNFVLPPSAEGEWWELRDETHSGTPYYYHTKTNETTWTKPDGFIIPLGIIQDTTLGRKLSQSTRRNSHLFSSTPAASPARRHVHPSRRSAAHAAPPSDISEQTEEASASAKEREKENARSDEKRGRKEDTRVKTGEVSNGKNNEEPRIKSDEDKKEKPVSPSSPHRISPGGRSRSKSSPHVAGAGTGGQSLTAAVEFLAGASTRDVASSSMPERVHIQSRSRSRSRSPSPIPSPERRRTSMAGLRLGLKTSRTDFSASASVPGTPTSRSPVPPNPMRAFSTPVHTPPTPHGAGKSPRRPIPAVPSLHSEVGGGFWRPRRNTSAGAAAPNIGPPVLDVEATRHMSPVQRAGPAKPIHVATKRLSTGEHPLLPRDLVSEIQQFAQSDFARRYFSTHREGLIFRRKVPVERMMMWQKTPMTSPLLVMNKSLHKDAVRIFKVVQRIMGDRDRDRPVGVRHTDSSSSLSLAASSNALLEEERWLLGEGVLHGEMRDEIYCQVIKQLSGNHNTESTFRGWQLLCVLLVTFPPSKNFEPYVRSFMQQRTTQSEGRVDVMAKYCLQRLTAIAKKGPRGKPPTIAEIENASDAAFNPSTFGESLDAVFRLQARTYPDLKVPVILPFLADGILALGGTKQEGIFRVPGDGDTVAELRLRLDKGMYTLDGIDDPHVPASLLKLWLRELLDPLVPEELYNECVACADDPERVVAMVGRLPTIHRRVVLFVVSFLQLFLEGRVLQATKMTSANLALVMAPNLLRCNSDSMSVVFTNAQYEHRFVHNLLVHMRCDQVDPEYVPEHGRGAVPTPTPARKSHQKSRRPKA